MAHPASDLPLALMVDASDLGIGEAVDQLNGETLEPLGFFSNALSPTQQKYSTYDRELLAAYSAIKHFRYCLEARNFCYCSQTVNFCISTKERQSYAKTTTSPRLHRSIYNRLKIPSR